MSPSYETAILAGGCFWGMQDLLRRYPGVISTRVGYSGGDVPNATYRNHGIHAEAIEIVFDPQKLTYRKLILGVADGWLEGDGRRIYDVKNMRVGLFSPSNAG